MNTYATLVADDARHGFDRPLGARLEPHHRPTAPPPRPPHAWLPWRCRNWPATPAEELRFVAELAQRADGLDGRDRHGRSEITAVLNALRGGLTAGELIDKLPGLAPHRLLAGYREVERRRAHAEQAWHAIVTDGTPDGLRRHGRDAATLVPVLVDRLSATVAIGDAAYPATIARLATYVDATHRNLTEVETALELWPERAVELGLRIYDPHGDAITNRVDHVARRVGTLTPTRVAALLGESPTAGLQPGN